MRRHLILVVRHLDNNYLPPDSPLKDDALNKGRISHVFTAAIACVVTLVIALGWISLAKEGDLIVLRSNEVRFYITISCLLAGASVFVFRGLRWYWAIFSGAILGPVYFLCCMFFLSQFFRA